MQYDFGSFGKNFRVNWEKPGPEKADPGDKK